MKDIAGMLCLFALLAGNSNVDAFQQRQQGHRRLRSPLTYGLQSQALPGGVVGKYPSNKMPFRKTNSRLASGSYGPMKPTGQSSKTGIRATSIPIELPRSRRLFRWPTPRTSAGVSDASSIDVFTPIAKTAEKQQQQQQQLTKETEKSQAGASRISKLDVALFLTYFCNMFVINLSVVTIPALSALSFSSPAASAAFESSVASMAPLGGAFGKVVNGFVVQKFGGRLSSIMYLVALAGLSCLMSVNKSLGAIGLFLVAYEFLSSIQWTAMCSVLDQETQDPSRIARGLAIMSMSSYTGALAAKTLGAALLNFSGCWKTVTQFGALAALAGATAMFMGTSTAPKNVVSAVVTNSDGEVAKKATNPLAVLKSILTNRLFWMIGIGHALGYVIRGSDRLLVPFLHEATGFPRHICASLTSSITLGFVLGLGQGTAFAGMKSISAKMKMLKNNYSRAIGSFLGLGVCALNVMHGWIQAPYMMAAAIALLSGMAASSISFQFSQFPNLVATNVFPENKAVALSLVDAAGFFVTSQVLTVNTRVLSTFGWSASWTFLALFLGTGTTLLMKNIHPVLVTERKKLQALGQ